ncbi:MBL fold metallo-hydrolase [Flaviaesturariibacter terrae]
MKRKDFLRYSSLIAGGALLFRQPALSAFVLPKSPAGTLRMLRNNVGIYTERGGTIGFHAVKEGLTVIDSQFLDTAPNFIEEVKKQFDQSFLNLLYTHHHRDHSSGGAAFKDRVAHVISQRNALANQKDASAKAQKPEEQLFADTVFDDELKLKVGEGKLKGYYYGAAHTNGDAVYHFDETNIAHVGDLVFNHRPPVVDRNYGASVQHWVEVLERIDKQFDKDTLFIFGHSAEGFEVTGSRADVIAFRDYLQRVLEFTQQEIRAGRSKEEFVKNTAVPGVDAWKGSPDRMLAAVWDELTAK